MGRVAKGVATSVRIQKPMGRVIENEWRPGFPHSSVFTNVHFDAVNIGEFSRSSVSPHERIYAQHELFLSGIERRCFNMTDENNKDTATLYPTKAGNGYKVACSRALKRIASSSGVTGSIHTQQSPPSR